jgi:hypothetical protein
MGLQERTIFVVNKAEGKSNMVARTKEFFVMRTSLPILTIKQRAEYACAAESGKGGIEVSDVKARGVGFRCARIIRQSVFLCARDAASIASRIAAVHLDPRHFLRQVVACGGTSNRRTEPTAGRP